MRIVLNKQQGINSSKSSNEYCKQETLMNSEEITYSIKFNYKDMFLIFLTVQ